MLHLPDDIRSHGPSWVYWCFVMERFCGSLLPSIKSRSNPYPSITKRTMESVQVAQIKKLYPDLKSILERQSRKGESDDSEDQEPTTAHETVYPECESGIRFRLVCSPVHMCQVPHTILCRPHRVHITLDHTLMDKLETHFKILFSTSGRQLAVDDVRPYVHQAHMDQWGKVRRAFGGDTIQSAMAMQGKDNCRDTSFVRVSLVTSIFHKIFIESLTYRHVSWKPEMQESYTMAGLSPSTSVISLLHRGHKKEHATYSHSSLPAGTREDVMQPRPW